jgi:hypothetical protein
MEILCFIIPVTGYIGLVRRMMMKTTQLKKHKTGNGHFIMLLLRKV